MDGDLIRAPVLPGRADDGPSGDLQHVVPGEPSADPDRLAELDVEGESGPASWEVGGLVNWAVSGCTVDWSVALTAGSNSRCLATCAWLPLLSCRNTPDVTVGLS